MSLFYNLLRDVRPRDAYAGFCVLAFLTVMTTRSAGSIFLLRDLFYVAAMGASVVLYARYYTQTAIAPTLTSAVTFAGLYGVTSVLATACDVIILKVFTVENTAVTFRQVASSASSFGLLIGFALGAGFDLAQRFPHPFSSAREELAAEEGELHAGQ